VSTRQPIADVLEVASDERRHRRVELCESVGKRDAAAGEKRSLDEGEQLAELVSVGIRNHGRSLPDQVETRAGLVVGASGDAQECSSEIVLGRQCKPESDGSHQIK